VFHNTQIATRQAYSFDGGICARRSRKNFSRYLALQAWAGTPDRAI
jgi:hypothetical protein